MATHRRIHTVQPFMMFHHSAMDVGYNIMSVRNNAVGVRNVMAHAGNCHIDIDCEFGLEIDRQRRKGRSD